MKKTALLFIVMATISYGTQAQHPEWTQPMGDALNKVQWMQQSDFGMVICGTKFGIYAIDNKTGKELWVNKDIPITANTSTQNFISGVPLMLIEYTTLLNKPRACIINILNGKLFYHSKDDGGKVAGSTVLNAADGILLEVIKDKEQILRFIDFGTAGEKWSISLGKEKGGIGLGAMVRKFGAVSFLLQEPQVMADGNILLARQNEMKSVNPQDGKVVWSFAMKKNIDNYCVSTDGKLIFTGSNDKFEVIDATKGTSFLNKTLKLKGNFNNIMPYETNYLVMHTGGFNIWDVSKMGFKWDKEKSIGNIQEITVCPNGFAGIEHGAKDSHIYFMDKEGKKLWDEKLDEDVLFTIPTKKGLWYITTNRSNVLSFEKGKDLWRRSVKLKGTPAMAFDKDAKKVIIYADRALYAFDVENVNMTVLNENIKFKDLGETDLVSLEVRTPGYLITTSQNNCLIDKTGKILVNDYYKEVGLSRGVKAGFGIVGLGTAFFGMASLGTDILGQNSLDPLTNLAESQNTSDVVKAYSNVSTTQVAFEASGAMLILANSRHQASLATRDNRYILTKFNDGTKGLLKLNKDTGKEEKRFLFKDNDPTYVVDEVDNKLYLVEKEKNILCFSTE